MQTNIPDPSQSSQSWLDEETEVYIEYESEKILLDEVTSYNSLKEQIEENFEGMKAQDLKITYKTLTGNVVTVKNDSTLKTAQKKMKPELILTCTLNTSAITIAPNAPPSQQNNPLVQKTEHSGTTPPIFKPQPHFPEIGSNVPIFPSQQTSNFGGSVLPTPPNDSMNQTQFIQSPYEPLLVLDEISSQSTSTFRQNLSPSDHQRAPDLNLTSFLPLAQLSPTPNVGQQPVYQVETMTDIQQPIPGSNQQTSESFNQYPPIFSPPEEQKSYPSLVINGQDAARCACGEFLSVSQPQMGRCPNYGCMLQANQTYTQLWSCQVQTDACGYFCWMCVQNKLRNCQMRVFEDVKEKNQVFITRVQQEQKCQPNYNPAPYVPTQTPLKVFEPIHNQQMFVPQKPLQPINPSVDLISPQDYITTPQAPQKVVDKPSQALIEPSLPSEQKILGLDQNVLKELEAEVIELYEDFKTIENEIVDYLCNKYNLADKKSELLKYIEQLNPHIKKLPTLPMIKAYLTKKRIIDYIVNDEKKPIQYKLLQEFENLKVEQLGQFKECYKDFNAISFLKDVLFEEENQLVTQLLNDGKSNEEISQITLIHKDLVEKLEFLNLIRKYSSCKTNDELIKLIDQDDHELVKVLIQAYKENQDKYHYITKKLKDTNLAKNFESSQQLKDALKEIDEEEERRKLPLGLYPNVLKELEAEVNECSKELTEIDNDCCVYLCKKYNLADKMSELTKYIDNLLNLKLQPNPPTNIQKWPTLPKIKAYLTKEKIIDLIVNEMPTPTNDFILEKKFEKLTVEQLNQFKECYKNFNAISFSKDDLFAEEFELVFHHRLGNKLKEEISKITLIHIELVEKLELLYLIRKQSDCKTTKEVIKLIDQDDQELVKVLIQAYKENKDE